MLMQSFERQQSADDNMQRRSLKTAVKKIPSFPMRLGFGNAVRLQSSPKNQGQATEDRRNGRWLQYSNLGLILLDSIPTLPLCKLCASPSRHDCPLLHRHIFVKSHQPPTAHISVRRTASTNVFLPTSPVRRATHSIF